MPAASGSAPATKMRSSRIAAASLAPGGEGVFACGALARAEQPQAFAVVERSLNRGRERAVPRVYSRRGARPSARSTDFNPRRSILLLRRQQISAETPAPSRCATSSRNPCTALPNARAANEPSGREETRAFEGVFGIVSRASRGLFESRRGIEGQRQALQCWRGVLLRRLAAIANTSSSSSSTIGSVTNGSTLPASKCRWAAGHAAFSRLVVSVD